MSTLTSALTLHHPSQLRLQNYHAELNRPDLVVPFDFSRWGEDEAPELFTKEPYDNKYMLDGKRLKILNVSNIYRDSPRDIPGPSKTARGFTDKPNFTQTQGKEKTEMRRVIINKYSW